MADYFTKFSLVFCLRTERQQQYALRLADQARRAQQGDEPPKRFPALLRDVLEDWQFETEAGSDPNTLWLHSEYGGIDAVCAFLCHLLRKFKSTDCVSFEWSHDCTKPRVDAYGGGAAVITAKKITTLNTAQWLYQQTHPKPSTRR